MQRDNRRFRRRVTDRIVTRRGFAPFSRRVTDRPRLTWSSPAQPRAKSLQFRRFPITRHDDQASQPIAACHATRFYPFFASRDRRVRTGTDRFSTSQPRIMHEGHAARVRHCATELALKQRPSRGMVALQQHPSLSFPAPNHSAHSAPPSSPRKQQQSLILWDGMQWWAYFAFRPTAHRSSRDVFRQLSGGNVGKWRFVGGSSMMRLAWVLCVWDGAQ